MIQTPKMRLRQLSQYFSTTITPTSWNSASLSASFAQLMQKPRWGPVNLRLDAIAGRVSNGLRVRVFFNGFHEYINSNCLTTFICHFVFFTTRISGRSVQPNNLNFLINPVLRNEDMSARTRWANRRNYFLDWRKLHSTGHIYSIPMGCI